MTQSAQPINLQYAGPHRAEIDGAPAVVCRGVVKHFGEDAARVTALRGIDLEVAGGELMMLVGPSGCGKTTLISVIAGILNQDEGVCEVYGREFSRMSEQEKTQHRGRTVGFVFQAFNLIPALTAAENVAVPLLIQETPRKQAIEKARDLLARVGLGDRSHSMPSQLSGGQQQRVAIARSLIHDPRLIVCDEPTSALDHETGQKVMELLREIGVSAGRSLIIVTHDARIFSFADRIARMDDGRVVEVEAPDSPEVVTTG
ncbi:MAG: ABC-type antimicrobial peptide transport system, ATPase component [Phycisphaerales bacterium]|nr:ABC-type antimicrobial peptide transport system, ATPase component [Phycisphaerales bacterium]MDB5353625.1 ABC-type antimicrobial peptide transport system, ATPase component [Phycisphaerales bacterium]